MSICTNLEINSYANHVRTGGKNSAPLNYNIGLSRFVLWISRFWIRGKADSDNESPIFITDLIHLWEVVDMELISLK